MEELGLVVLMSMLFVLGAVCVVVAKISDWAHDR